MLKIVIKKPMLVTIVNAVPINSLGAVLAVRAEYCGESPTTTIPQKIRNAINTGSGAKKNKGDNKQHNPDALSWKKATFALPDFCEIIPPTMHPRLPDPIITNDQKEISIDSKVFTARYVERITGTKAQNA